MFDIVEHFLKVYHNIVVLFIIIDDYSIWILLILHR